MGVCGDRLSWVVLTMGDRADELARAVDSIVTDLPSTSVIVVSNGGGPVAGPLPSDVREIRLPENVGVPGGRDIGLRAADTPLVAFLDDDATLEPGAAEAIQEAFRQDARLGAVSLHIVDQQGQTARRHVPRPGRSDPGVGGEVALFLGGACAIRADAYHSVGGYFTELGYGHEELELSWRLVDGGWRIRYLADVVAHHPSTPIERHAEGWWLTGRNRVWIARRTLPWPIAIVHTFLWLVLGTVRAPRGRSRRSYLSGWRSGWRADVGREPIRWSTVWRLTRLGRPPLI